MAYTMGKAVEFSEAIKNPNGVAKIKDHIFYRWDFVLHSIYNSLSMENTHFVKEATVDFVAKNSIELQEGTFLEPEGDSYVSLVIDSQLPECTEYPAPTPDFSTVADNEGIDTRMKNKAVLLYPNPTENVLHLKSEYSIDKVIIYNINGQVLETPVLEGDEKQYSTDVSKLNSGIYFIEVYYNKQV